MLCGLELNVNNDGYNNPKKYHKYDLDMGNEVKMEHFICEECHNKCNLNEYSIDCKICETPHNIKIHKIITNDNNQNDNKNINPNEINTGSENDKKTDITKCEDDNSVGNIKSETKTVTAKEKRR